MTNLFDRYIDYILEATSFLDLPEKPPYGFWISPGGEFFPVKFERHYEEALKIITRNRTLNQEYDKEGTPYPYSFLSARKYIRVVIDGNSYHADLFSYNDSPFEGIDDTSPTTPFTPTNTSVKLIKDIGEFYGKTIIFNKS